jgi:hypothetical protein
MLEEVANQKELAIDWMALDPDASHFMDQTLSRLGAAAKESIRPICSSIPVASRITSHVDFGCGPAAAVSRGLPCIGR